MMKMAIFSKENFAWLTGLCTPSIDGTAISNMLQGTKILKIIILKDFLTTKLEKFLSKS
jgi:hypothetical protein